MDERERVLGILEELTGEELKKFAYLLPDAIPHGKRDTDSRVNLAKVILQYCPENALDVLVEVLNKIPKKDLVLHLKGDLRRGAPPPPKLVSQEQLMKLARKMGKNWKEIGILFLGMEISRLEQFEEEHSKNMTMQIFSMLCDWRNREKNKATACDLYNILNQEGVELDLSAYAFLLE
ncbi:Protein FADD, partial [Ophiophagus hannah]